MYQHSSIYPDIETNVEKHLGNISFNDDMSAVNEQKDGKVDELERSSLCVSNLKTWNVLKLLTFNEVRRMKKYT